VSLCSFVLRDVLTGYGLLEYLHAKASRITKDRISNHSIRLPGMAMTMPGLPSMSIMGRSTTSASGKDRDASGEEQWTRACRAVLLLLKRILVVESEADRSGDA
jgi:hypothetical protein